MNRPIALRRISFLLFLSALILVAALPLAPTPTAIASSSISDTLYFHVDPSSSYQVGSVNTGGVILNSTTLGLSTSGNTKSSGATGSYSQTWYLSQLLAGSLTASGTPTMKLDLYAGAASSWNYTIQIIQATSSGSTVNVLSQSQCIGAKDTCLQLTSSQALYAFTFGSISSTTLTATQMIEVSIHIYECTGTSCTSSTNTTNLVVENNNPSLTSYFTLPLSSPAVTINSLTLSPASVAGSQASTATLSVSDAFGLYDLATQTLTASVSGGTNAINAAQMTPASSNAPTAYTGTFTYPVAPSLTSYGSFQGIWSVQSSVTDQTGNSYSSQTQYLTYSVGGGCSSCGQSFTAASSSQTMHSTSQYYGWNLPPNGVVLIIGVTILVLIGVVVVLSRRS